MIKAARLPSLERDMAWVAGGVFSMGSDRHYPEESPAHRVRVDGFWIDRTPVTNRDFRAFVDATGYTTLAEIAPIPDDYPGAVRQMLRAGSLVFTPPHGRVDLRNSSRWWEFVFGADWQHPYGPNSSIEGCDEHPVVHVAYTDVEAYARWAGKDVPTEAEWEYAARGGLDGAEYAWGDEAMPNGRHMANTWQGEFPRGNLCADGYELTSPVGAFPPNGYGLYDMIGNVWEWTGDWYTCKHLCTGPREDGIVENPAGGIEAASYDGGLPSVRIPRKVIKGASHLSAANYCFRYRPAARQAQQIDASASHLGFRCIVRGPTGGQAA